MSPVFALKPVSTFKTWNVYQTTNKAGKDICYVFSIPIEKRGNFKKRGEPYYMVMRTRGSEFDEIVVSGGSLFDEKKDADITILKRRFPLLVEEERGVTYDRNDDVEIVKQMGIGAKAYVTSFFQNGTYAVDTYSLLGFTQAHDEIIRLCRK
jgi:hypothetical protein